MAAEPVNIFEYEEIARERIQKGDYDYIAGGATDEITVRRTRAVVRLHHDAPAYDGGRGPEELGDHSVGS